MARRRGVKGPLCGDVLMRGDGRRAPGPTGRDTAIPDWDSLTVPIGTFSEGRAVHKKLPAERHMIDEDRTERTSCPATEEGGR
jgi:hypothetical protein